MKCPPPGGTRGKARPQPVKEVETVQILFSSLIPIKRPFMASRPITRADEQWWAWQEIPRWEADGEYEVVGVVCATCRQLIDETTTAPRRDGRDRCNACKLNELYAAEFEKGGAS
jgi:hypothetical protein